MWLNVLRCRRLRVLDTNGRADVHYLVLAFVNAPRHGAFMQLRIDKMPTSLTTCNDVALHGYISDIVGFWYIPT